MEISLVQVQCLVKAVEQIPSLTPNRWQLISELVTDCGLLTSSGHECPTVILGGGEKSKSIGKFNGSPKECKDAYEMLQNVEGLHNDDALKCLEVAISQTTNNVLKPIILVPYK